MCYFNITVMAVNESTHQCTIQWLPNTLVMTSHSPRCDTYNQFWGEKGNYCWHFSKSKTVKVLIFLHLSLDYLVILKKKMIPFIYFTIFKYYFKVEPHTDHLCAFCVDFNWGNICLLPLFAGFTILDIKNCIIIINIIYLERLQFFFCE